MGDWDDFCASRGWANDEYAVDKLINHIERGNKEEQERELRENGYKTVNEWNAVGRSIKKGEKGISRLFSEEQTIESKLNRRPENQPEINLTNKSHFSTFEEAIMWAKNNPGKAIIRSSTGEGYIVK